MSASRWVAISPFRVLLDHARACEADQRPHLGDMHIAKHGYWRIASAGLDLTLKKERPNRGGFVLLRGKLGLMG